MQEGVASSRHAAPFRMHFHAVIDTSFCQPADLIFRDTVGHFHGSISRYFTKYARHSPLDSTF